MKKVHNVQVFDTEFGTKVMLENFGTIVSIHEYAVNFKNDNLTKESSLYIDTKDVATLINVLKKLTK